jgi:hypothetical protein
VWPRPCAPLLLWLLWCHRYSGGSLSCALTASWTPSSISGTPSASTATFLVNVTAGAVVMTSGEQ